MALVDYLNQSNETIFEHLGSPAIHVHGGASLNARAFIKPDFYEAENGTSRSIVNRYVLFLDSPELASPGDKIKVGLVTYLVTNELVARYADEARMMQRLRVLLYAEPNSSTGGDNHQ